MYWASPIPFIIFPPVPQNQHWNDRTCWKELNCSPLLKQIQDSEETQSEDGEEVMLGYYFSRWTGRTGYYSLLVSWEATQGQTASCGLFGVTVTAALSSWEGSSPGCSSRCSGSHSCRTVVAGKESQQTGNNFALFCNFILYHSTPYLYYSISLLYIKQFYYIFGPQ